MPLDQSKHIDYDDESYGGEKDMSFLDHLEELRWHLVRAVGSILVFTILAFIYIKDIYREVILAPTRADFWTYRQLCKLSDIVGIKSICIEDLHVVLQSREMTGQFMMAITSSIIIGLIFTFPYAIWEIWRFIKPGLKAKERKAATGAIFYVTMLFFMGVAFGYYVLAALSVVFLSEFQLDPNIPNQFDITSYISVLASVVLGCGIMFQMPIIGFVLAKIGLLTPTFMREYRRHAYVVILVIGAAITPSPDPFSMMIVALPLCLLYEVSIGVAGRVEKANLKDN